MRLSDAIAMGRVLITLQMGTMGDGVSGCALGMAESAAGMCLAGKPSRTLALAAKFPILNMVGIVDPLSGQRIRGWTMLNVIVRLFDHHVMAHPQKWTLDQLIDWVRKTEDELGFGDSVVEVATETATVEVAQ
jgi:hypothetical protein